jgi:uncharacterized protein (TIGR00369 family)
VTNEVRTHRTIDRALCGEPLEVGGGRARVVLDTEPRMAADERGLVHGGFAFGLADHAAMLAVNHPNVVLAGAEVRFLRPVRAGERLVAEAELEASVQNTAAGDGPNTAAGAGPNTAAGTGPNTAAGAGPHPAPGADARPWVAVTVRRDGEPVMSGRFRCYVPERHVLDGEG